MQWPVHLPIIHTRGDNFWNATPFPLKSLSSCHQPKQGDKKVFPSTDFCLMDYHFLSCNLPGFYCENNER